MINQAATRAAGRRSILLRVDPVLLAILCCGAALRVWGIRYGLPDVYNPDESSILLRALSLGSGTLNPHNFVYPSLYLYVLAMATGGWFLAEYVMGLTPSLHAFQAAFLVDPSSVYVVARLLSAAAGVATIVATYAAARRVGDRTLARIAAVLLAVSYISVRDAHFVKHDVPVTLFVMLVVLAAWRVWQRGSTWDYALAGGAVGVAFAFHYYAMFTAVPLLAAHWLQVRGIRRFVLDRRIWLAGVAAIVLFACLSPYVLIDFSVAWRDIVANRQIVVGRGISAYGPFGAGIEHARLLATQGAGFALIAAALAGIVVLAVEAPGTAIWLWSFPVAFFLFISNAWPFGRLENPLYPFIAIAGAVAIQRVTRRLRSSAIAAVLLTAACVAQPLVFSVQLDWLLTRPDTRTLARHWIEANVAPGTAVAVQPYSVQLTMTREALRQALERNLGAADRASRRFKEMLKLDPYPAPAYDVLVLGRGMGQERRYLDPTDSGGEATLAALRQAGVRVLVLKRFTPGEADPLRDAAARSGHLAYTVSPFVEGVTSGDAQLPDYDIRPSWVVDRPGPIIEVWRITE